MIDKPIGQDFANNDFQISLSNEKLILIYFRANMNFSKKCAKSPTARKANIQRRLNFK